MMNSEELFEINRRINQIKRNLQSRQERANEWSVPYQKILKNNEKLAQTTANNFRKTHNQQNIKKQNATSQQFYTKRQKKQYFDNKVKESRKKIADYHNQLKELQQLLQKKTKLHIKKVGPSQKQSQKENFVQYEARFQLTPNQSKIINKTFNSSMLFMGSTCKPPAKNAIRTMKDRTNPFTGFKVEKMIQLYNQMKISGKQGILNQSLGIGIQFTPYSNLKKEQKRVEENQHKEDATNCEFSSSVNIQNVTVSRTCFNKNFLEVDENHAHLQQRQTQLNKFPKILESKIQNNKQIYLYEPCHKKPGKATDENIFGITKKNLNIFEQRMKNLLQETGNIQNGNNFTHNIKRSKSIAIANGRPFQKIGRVQANRPYRQIFLN